MSASGASERAASTAFPAWLRPLSGIPPVGVGVRSMRGLSRFEHVGRSRALVSSRCGYLAPPSCFHLKGVFRRDAPVGAQAHREPQPGGTERRRR
ncbi:hypothetical protein [Streptomyces hokutonensis]|uniref:hypothetical protein n=1 Tax=Streptomyces hokutonensis TaxID=1306990 RepID=UPI0038159F26